MIRYTREQVEGWFTLLGISLPGELKSRPFPGEAGLPKIVQDLKDLAKKRFRGIALRMHPDKDRGSGERFKRISDAYSSIQKHFNLFVRRPEPVMRVIVMRDIFGFGGTNMNGDDFTNSGTTGG